MNLQEKISLHQLRMKRKYDVRAEAPALKEGDKVWLYNPQKKKGVSPKLSRSWQGRYTVVKKVDDLVFCKQGGKR